MMLTKPDDKTLIKSTLLFLLILSLMGVSFFNWLNHRKPEFVGYRFFDDLRQDLREAVYNAIAESPGVERDIDGKVFIVTDKETFLTELKETIYRRTPTWRDMTGYLDAGVFKILVRDNVCFIRADLDQFAHYVSCPPFRTKRSLVDYAVRWSEDFFEDGARIEKGGVGGHCFIGSHDVNPPVLFTEGMNDLYNVIFVFSNSPPLILEEIP
jgi:hypothetical protein